MIDRQTDRPSEFKAHNLQRTWLTRGRFYTQTDVRLHDVRRSGCKYPPSPEYDFFGTTLFPSE